MVKKQKENKIVMAIAIQPELKSELVLYAKRREETTSGYVGKLIESAVKIAIDEEPIVFGISNSDSEFFIHYINPALHTELKSYLQLKEMNVSDFLNNLIEKALKISVDEEPMIIGKPANEEIIPVVLKIPATLKGQMEALKQWIEPQVSGIVNKLGV